MIFITKFREAVRIRSGPLLLLSAAGMSTVARDLDHILIIGVSAMIAAIFVVSAYRTATAVVTTSVIDVCH
jgi:hypothetical protein